MSYSLGGFVLTEEEMLLASKTQDMAMRVERSAVAKYSFFLNEREQAIAKAVLLQQGVRTESYCFFGGYDAAERVVLGVFPDYFSVSNEDAGAGALAFPIVPITFSYRKADKLSHRDFLGSLMALQLRRETVGDILVGDGLAVAFVYQTIAATILDSIIKIGSTGVSLKEGIPQELPCNTDFAEIEGTVASLRLDAVLSLATALSRERAADLIKGGSVQLNHTYCENASASVREGDGFSVRGFGRFSLTKLGNVSKKGRTHITVRKYL